VRELEEAAHARDRQNERLKKSRDRYRDLFDQAAEPMFTLDAEGRFTSANRAAVSTFGVEIESLVSMHLGDLVEPSHLDALAPVLAWARRGGRAVTPIDLPMRTRMGQTVWTELSVRAVGDGERLTLHCTAHDIADRRLAEEAARQQALHDPLTGLPNRGLFDDRLRMAISDSQRRNEVVGVFYLDLDRFKHINDTLGHAVGDALLSQVAERIVGSLRETDTVSRRGGDEFTVILPRLERTDDLATLAQRLLHAFATPFECLDHRIYVTTSIGVASFPADARDGDGLVQCADIAMYRAKHDGRNTYQFFEEAMRGRVHERRAIEELLRRAVRAEALELHYQPRIDAGGKATAVEALVRVDTGTHGLMSATQFVAIAEETGLIVPLGQWVMREALRQLAAWRRDGQPSLRVVLNVSLRELIHGNYRTSLARALDESGVPASAVQVEFPDSPRVRDTAAVVEAARELLGLGVSLGLDRAFTGAGTMSYLRELPISTASPPPSLLGGSDGPSPRDALLIEGMLQACQRIGTQVLALGVESQAQLDWLARAGCGSFQGHLLARSAPAAEVRFDGYGMGFEAQSPS
jgi:diguanylate cyclase (GGDEF)-like protein/PAS domain S-box-containing protein